MSDAEYIRFLEIGMLWLTAGVPIGMLLTSIPQFIDEPETLPHFIMLLIPILIGYILMIPIYVPFIIIRTIVSFLSGEQKD